MFCVFSFLRKISRCLKLQSFHVFACQLEKQTFELSWCADFVFRFCTVRDRPNAQTICIDVKHRVRVESLLSWAESLRTVFRIQCAFAMFWMKRRIYAWLRQTQGIKATAYLDKQISRLKHTLRITNVTPVWLPQLRSCVCVRVRVETVCT